MIRDWNEAADFIQRERWKEDRAGVWSYNPRIYGNYQALARSWSTDAVVRDRNSSQPPTRAEGPGDETLPGDAGPDTTGGT